MGRINFKLMGKPQNGRWYFIFYLTPPVVLEGVLDGRDAQDKDDGNHGHFLAKCAYSWNPVEQDDKKKVEIGEAVKLLQQILWYERERCVFGRTDGIVRVSPVWMVSRFNVWRYHVIWNDSAHPGQFGSFGLAPK